MRIRLVLTLVVVGAIGALLVGVPPGSARGPNNTFRDANWMPRNLVGIVLYETGHTPGGGHLAPYRSLGGRERAESDLAWLRITEVYAPSHPSHYMETRRSLGYAYAALGQYGRAARRMREAALYPNEEEFFGGNLNILDWQQAVYLTYEAHGLEASLEVWREGRDALRLNEDSYLDAAIEDGSVLFVDADIVLGEAPDWWSEELDYFEDRYAAETRTVLVERLLDDGEPAAAHELMDAIEASGFAGWPLTLARIRLALAAPGGTAQSERLADLTAPLLVQWVGISHPHDIAPGAERVLRLHDRLERCDAVRPVVDRLADRFLRLAAQESSDPSGRRYFAWESLGEACRYASLAADGRASSVCRRYVDMWQEDADAFAAGTFETGYTPLPANLMALPEALACAPAELP